MTHVFFEDTQKTDVMTHVESFVGHTKFKFLLFALYSDGDHHEGILHCRFFVVDRRDRDEAYSDCIHHHM